MRQSIKNNGLGESIDMGYRTLLCYHSFVDRIQKLQDECKGGLASAEIFNSGAVC